MAAKRKGQFSAMAGIFSGPAAPAAPAVPEQAAKPESGEVTQAVAQEVTQQVAQQVVYEPTQQVTQQVTQQPAQKVTHEVPHDPVQESAQKPAQPRKKPKRGAELKTARVQLVLPPSLLEQLRTTAAGAGLSMNEYACRVLGHALDTEPGELDVNLTNWKRASLEADSYTVDELRKKHGLGLTPEECRSLPGWDGERALTRREAEDLLQRDRCALEAVKTTMRRCEVLFMQALREQLVERMTELGEAELWARQDTRNLLARAAAAAETEARRLKTLGQWEAAPSQCPEDARELELTARWCEEQRGKELPKKK